MSDVIVIGGGLAGLASAAALAGAGLQVQVFESRPFLGGRATSFPMPSAGGATETIDNCQHVLMGCCVNLLDFYQRLGVADQIRFHREFYFLEPGGRLSTIRAASPLGLLRASFLTAADKIALLRALLAIRLEYGSRDDLDRITMLDWLRQKGQTPGVIERFWRQVLVSAINEEPERMAACHGFQVMRLGFLAGAAAAAMGVPAVPLDRLYGAQAWEKTPGVSLNLRSPVGKILTDGDAVVGIDVDGQIRRAGYYVSAVPFDRIGALTPDLGCDVSAFSHSPITGIHLWFDRPVTELPYAALLDRTVQWFFNKSGGRYLQLVVSASHRLTEMSRQEIIDLALRELGEFLPLIADAKLERAHVVKEMKATFSARPGLESLRPVAATRLKNFFLAGDWTRSGWPATMEGAVRSGYLAAEAVTAAAGAPRRFLHPDVA